MTTRRWLLGCTAFVVLLAGCGDLEDDEEPAVSVSDRSDDQQRDDEITDEDPAVDDESDEIAVFVFAENASEERYYEELRQQFEAETGVSVTLEVRRP